MADSVRARPSEQALAVPATPANAVDGPSGFDPSRDYFETAEWEEDPFHTIEVQACSKTLTIQFGVGDFSGDYYGENPSGVALNLSDAEALACFVLDSISTIRAIATAAGTDETRSGSAEGKGAAPQGDRPNTGTNPTPLSDERIGS